MDNNKDEDPRDWDDDDEDISDVFKNIGRDLSKLLDKLAKEGEAGFDAFSNIEDIEDLREGEGFDINNLRDLMSDFGLGETGFEDFQPGTADRKEKNQTRRSQESETRKPNVDVFDEDDRVDVFVELPGIKEEQIQIQLQNDSIYLQAGEEPTKFETTIDLPTDEITSFSKTLKNGILHLTLNKE
ncbi:MAG: Hsp20/alpha crystallin family protein [Candidatus Bipolaricaulota bacterium]